MKSMYRDFLCVFPDTLGKDSCQMKYDIPREASHAFSQRLLRHMGYVTFVIYNSSLPQALIIQSRQ